MQFLTYFNTLGHLETWDPLQQLSAWQWDTAAGNQVFRLTHGSTKTQVTDCNFQGICQAISSIQINHHLYYFYLEIVHIISKRSNGQVSKLSIGTDLHCSFLALLGCTSWRTPQTRAVCVTDDKPWPGQQYRDPLSWPTSQLCSEERCPLLHILQNSSNLRELKFYQRRSLTHFH